MNMEVRDRSLYPLWGAVFGILTVAALTIHAVSLLDIGGRHTVGRYFFMHLLVMAVGWIGIRTMKKEEHVNATALWRQLGPKAKTIFALLIVYTVLVVIWYFATNTGYKVQETATGYALVDHGKLIRAVSFEEYDAHQRRSLALFSLVWALICCQFAAYFLSFPQRDSTV